MDIEARFTFRAWLSYDRADGTAADLEIEADGTTVLCSTGQCEDPALLTLTAVRPLPCAAGASAPPPDASLWRDPTPEERMAFQAKAALGYYEDEIEGVLDDIWVHRADPDPDDWRDLWHGDL